MVDVPLHFDVVDFKGNRIICTELQWNDHVIGDPCHTYMEGCEARGYLCITSTRVWL